MKYAIVESGGKQYRAVEGETIEVDRLDGESGAKVKLEKVLLLVNGDQATVGMPVLGEVAVMTTMVGHVLGPKLDRFKYSPKKRIRVRGGHRQQYTRLRVDFIGKPGEVASPVSVAEPAAKKPARRAPSRKPATAKPADAKPAAKKVAPKSAAKKK